MLRFSSIILLFFTINNISFAQTAEFVWAKRIGGNFSSDNVGRNIIVNNAGEVYLTGIFYSTVDFNPGPGTANLSVGGAGFDAFLAKYDSSGNYLWAFKIGDGSEVGYTVLLDDSTNVFVSGTFGGKTDFNPGPDTAYITGLTYFDTFIAKYTKDGNYLWAKRCGGSYGITSIRDKIIALDKSGNVFVAGQFQDTAYFNNVPDSNYIVSKGAWDAFFAKYDAAGNFLWAGSIEGMDSSIAHIPCIATDDTGNCYITGTIDPLKIYDFAPGPDTAYLSTTGSWADGFIAKYDADGNYVWAHAIDGITKVNSKSITVDKNNDVYIAGSIIDDADFDPGPGVANLNPVNQVNNPFFAKYDSNGNFILAGKIAAYGGSSINSITVDSTGKIFLTGLFASSSDDFDPGPDTVNLIYYGNTDAFFAVYDAQANYILAQSMYGNGKNVAYGICLNNENQLLITGDFYDTMYFNNSATEYLVSKGSTSTSENIFFAKYQLDFTINVKPVEEFSRKIYIYPNPTHNQFYLRGNFLLPAIIELYDITGRKIFQSPINNPQSAINISYLSKGIYIYEIRNGEQVQRGKLVKE